MYHHAIGAHEVTGLVSKRAPKHHNHLLLDSAAAIVTAMLLTDCAFEGNSGVNDAYFAMNLTPYFDNCLEDDFGC